MEKKKNEVEGGFNALMQNKKQFSMFIIFAIALLLSLFFLFKMSLSGLTLVYIITIIAGSAGMTYYNYSTTKKNTTILFFSLLILIVSFILRVVQSSIGGNIEYIVRYLLFFIATLMIFYNSYKNESKTKVGLIKLFLLVGAGDAIYSFFSLGNISFLGYVWRLFLLSEALIAIGLAFSNYEFDALKDLNKTYKDIVAKLPKIMVIIICVIVVGGIFYVFNLDGTDYNNSFDPIDKDNTSNSGSIIDHKDDYEEDDEEDEPYIETKKFIKIKILI